MDTERVWGREAVIEYFSGDYRIVRPGDHVVCAVTGRRIPLAELRYWNPDLQEAYASAEIAVQRYKDLLAEQKGKASS